MKVLFMGTPDFAVGCLDALYDNGHEIVGVFSQPDKPVGRKQILTPPPVKARALELGLNVYQPTKLKDGSALELIKSLAPDIIVVVAYGRILPKDILEYPKYGCVNIHASLLPKLRGAAPINFAIINGEKKSGVTSMYMDVGLDTGDMLIKRELDIDDEMTAGDLFDRLAVIGADVLIETLVKIEDGTIERTPQNDDEATYASIMDKTLGKIDFSKSAREIHNLVRGTEPWPGAYCEFDGKTLKICKTRIADESKASNEAGCVVTADRKKGIVVACGAGLLEIVELQLQGKRRMSAADFLNGNALTEGSLLK